MSPVSDAQLGRLIGLLDLPPGARVLDLCCGKAEVLFRVLEAYPGATGVGVDRSPALLAEARAEADRRGLAERVSLREGDAWEEPVGEGFDAVLSLGGAYPNDDRRAFYAGLWAKAGAGGVVLVGDGFFVTPPDAGDLAADGWTEEDIPRHGDHVALARTVGLHALYTTAAGPEAWDDYEGLYLRAIERWARGHPDDPEAGAMVEFVRWWHGRYLDWRRDHLGFGLYLFQRGTAGV